MKTAEMLVDLVRSTKYPYRMADPRVGKANQSRHERRKIREFLRMGDWAIDNT